MSEFEKLGTDPEVWAGAFAQRFAIAISAEHGFVDTRAVLSAWFHYLAHAVREAERKRAAQVVLYRCEQCGGIHSRAD